MRPVLLIVRAGDRSLHPRWLEGAAERRFDLHISYFGKAEAPFADRPADVTLSCEPGMKFPGLADCLDKIEARLGDYRWIGLPDDDLLSDAPTWNQAVGLLEELEPRLAQPALHPRSFYSHQITLQRPGLKARWTDFVEVMTPILDRDLLEQVRSRFRDSLSGWGLDYLWSRTAGERACILDAAPVLHTRKVMSGASYQAIGDSGTTPLDEMAAAGHVQYEPRTWKGLSLSGEIITDEERLNRRVKTPWLLKRWRCWRKPTEIG